MREIVYARFESFYVTAERPRDASIELPFVLLKDGEVLDVSPAARAWNVREHISARLARQRCPGLALLEHNPDLCLPLFHKVWSVFENLTPQIEPIDLHEGYLDLTGCLKGRSLQEIMDEAAWRVHFDTGLKTIWGGGCDRWMARLSCGENRSIAENEEPDFLAKVSIERLDLPAILLERLARYGIHTVAALLAVPHTFFQTHLQLTDAEVEPFLKRGDSLVKSLFPSRALSLEADTNSTEPEDIGRVVTSLSERAATKLQDSAQQCGRLEISLRMKHDVQSHVFKPAQPVFSASVFEGLLRSILTEDVTATLRSIGLALAN